MKKDIKSRVEDKELFIYSLRHKADKPLYSIDFLFRRTGNGKLEWMMYSDGLRGGCFIGKDDLTLFDNINDFVEYRKELLSKVGLFYPYEIFETKPLLGIGEYYPNIYRPDFSSKLQNNHFIQDSQPFLDSFDDPFIYDKEEYGDYVRQLEIIINELNDVFKVIAPTEGNYKSYGNAIRNIIVLACTEIDSMMHNVLVRNEWCKEKDHLTMNHYRILNEAMRLNEYSISFNDYTQLGAFFPFKEWSVKGESLTWYKAYNHVKHKRYENFAEANLENAILSVMGFAIFLVAQYGKENNIWKRKIGSYLSIKKQPLWKLEEYYIPFTTEVEPIKKNFPFSKKMDEKSEVQKKYLEVGKILKEQKPKSDVVQAIDELKEIAESEYKA